MSIQKSIPIFDKSNLAYIREEKKGFVTLISKNHPEMRELVINSTSNEMLQLCDGNNSVGDILNSLTKKYYKVPEEVLKKDLSNLYGNMSRLGILDWKTENPFILEREVILDDTHSLKVCSEENFRELYNFYKDGLNNKFSQAENIVYFCPYTIKDEYGEISIRQKIFSYTEEFFALYNKDKLEGLLSIKLPMNPSQSAMIRTCIVPKNYMEPLLNYGFETLPYISVVPVTKVKFMTDKLAETDSTKIISAYLEKDSFVSEGIYKNEIGFGHDIKILSRLYDEKTVLSINKKRNIQW